MSKQQFTPGPWEVVPYGDGDSLVVHAGEDWRICFMATPGESPGAASRIEANARLIAASPCLYEALSRLLAVAEMTTFSDSYPLECEIARAALAKAGGEG